VTARCARRDHGAGTVLVLTAVMVVALTCLVVVGSGAAMLARARAAAAADSAALAAAADAQLAPAQACARAAAMAGRNGARLTSCRLVGPSALVGVAMSPPDWLRWAGVARLDARAGPAETTGDETARPARAS